MPEPLNDHPYGQAQHPEYGADPGEHEPSGSPGTPEPHGTVPGPEDRSEGRAVPIPPNVHPANAQPCGGTYAHAAHRWFGYWCAGADEHGLRPIERPAIADQPFLSRLCRDGECGRCHASDCIHPCHRGDALAEALTDEPPLIDPDCRDGKCGSCVGGECEHTCHHPEAKPAGEASTVQLPADVDPQLIRWCRATVKHGPHWWPAAPVAKWCGGVDANGLVRYVDVSSPLVHGMADAVRDAVGPDITAEGAAALGLDQPAGEVPPSEVLADMRAQRHTTDPVDIAVDALRDLERIGHVVYCGAELQPPPSIALNANPLPCGLAAGHARISDHAAVIRDEHGQIIGAGHTWPIAERGVRVGPTMIVGPDGPRPAEPTVFTRQLGLTRFAARRAPSCPLPGPHPPHSFGIRDEYGERSLWQCHGRPATPSAGSTSEQDVAAPPAGADEVSLTFGEQKLLAEQNARLLAADARVRAFAASLDDNSDDAGWDIGAAIIAALDGTDGGETDA